MGPELGGLKGKTTRQSSSWIHMENHSIPLMKVSGISFLMTISKHIKFGSVGKLDNMNNSNIIKHFKAVIGAYVTRGFRVTIILANNQFESMQ